MKRTVAELAALGVALYVALAVALRLALGADKDGEWSPAIIGATGIMGALLTGALVGITAWYARLTARLVELEATAPTRSAQEKAMRDFLGAFVPAEDACLNLRSSLPGLRDRKDLEVVALLELVNKIQVRVLRLHEAMNDLYRITHQLPTPLADKGFGASTAGFWANQQANLLCAAMLAEGTAANETPARVVTWEGIRVRFDSEVRSTLPLEDRQEWEDVEQLAKCDVALSALRELRTEIRATLNRQL